MEPQITVRQNKDGVYFFDISDELYKQLLKSARITQKGRRGLSSKKARVRKKIVATEMSLAVLREIEAENEGCQKCTK